MDELAVANVDAHMAEGAAHGVEEHQVAGLEFVAVDLFRGCRLLLGAAWQHQANRLGVHGAHKTTAIKAGFGAVAATLIGHAQETHGVADQLGSLGAQLRGTGRYVVPHVGDAGQQAVVGGRRVAGIVWCHRRLCIDALHQG